MHTPPENIDRIIENWGEHSLTAISEAVQALHQCYVTRSNCSRVREQMRSQQSALAIQRERLAKDTARRQSLKAEASNLARPA